MIGEYTKVPLRLDERWTGARMQQGRVLLDHEWNLNLDAGARAARAAAADVIGSAGVVEGSDDFEVGVTPSGTLDLTVHAGRIWVDGLLAVAPAAFTYSSQGQIAPLPASGRALVYLDVFEEHVQPAEDASLVDPALAPVDTAARTRGGDRVRAAATTAETCADAWAGLTRVGGSTGSMSIARTAPAAPPDPCAPPGDPLGQLPDGLFRVEVIDGGNAGSARFAWSFENGGAAVAVASFAGDQVTLAPSAAVKFRTGDTIEVSWLARRADRVAHGALYTIAQPPQTGPGGDILTLDRAVAAPAGAAGLALRRWDGEAVGATSARTASLLGADLGVRFTAGAGSYVVGDWWGARVREEEGLGIEVRSGARPDGTPHAFAPLALVDLTARTVLRDCRPTFVPLTELKPDAGACTVSVRPGDDLQAAVDSLPAGGGELCLAAGVYELTAPLEIASRRRIVVAGAGPASILRAVGAEAALTVRASDDVQVRHVRVEGGSPAGAGDPHLNGAITVLGSGGISIADCVVACPSSRSGRSQTCISVRSDGGRDPDAIRIERNRLEVGAWETGVLLVDAGDALVAANRLSLPPGAQAAGLTGADELVVRGLRALVANATHTVANPTTKPVTVRGAGQVHVTVGSDGEKLVDALAARVPESEGARRGALKALAAAARHAIEPELYAKLGRPAQAIVDKLREDLVVVGQGIVVGGARAGTVQVLDNVVEDVVQGIHVGLSTPKQAGREAADEVMIARNHVHSLVPRFYDRDRYAVFVGNVRSVHVVDNVARLRRTGKYKLAPTPVEGVRIHGELGPFACVRQTSLRDFSVGVRVVPVGPVPAQRVWLVAETMAAGATAALAAPLSVDRQRNVP